MSQVSVFLERSEYCLDRMLRKKNIGLCNVLFIIHGHRPPLCLLNGSKRLANTNRNDNSPTVYGHRVSFSICLFESLNDFKLSHHIILLPTAKQLCGAEAVDAKI